jgi:hypothetical protein
VIARRAVRIVVAGLVAGLTLTASPPSTVPAGAAPATRGEVAAAAVAGPSVQIIAITPDIPEVAADPATDQQPIRFTIVVTAGDQPLTGGQLQLQRGNPLISEAQLDAALKTAPPTDDVDIPAVSMGPTLAAGQSRTVTLTSTVAATLTDGTQGLCLSCNPGIYPIDVALSDTGTGVELARAHTFVPYFDSAPAAVQVSWIWPLLDRPHRSLSRTTFDDDDLATSVSPGGRLWRLLQVADDVAGRIRLTLVVDPDLIDSLVVMSAGYRVRTADGSVAGTGSMAAAAWLRELADLSTKHDVVRTAYADPDVDSLSRAGVNWSTTLDQRQATALTSALGVSPGTWLTWPDQNTLSGAGLDQVVANGASAVLLGDSMFPSTKDDTTTRDALAPLPSAAGGTTAVVLDSGLESWLATAISPASSSSDAFAARQRIAVSLAARARQNPASKHYVALVPDRYADPDVARTVATMTTFADAPYVTDLSLARALKEVAAVDHGALSNSGGGAGLAADQLATLASARANVDALRECLRNNDAATLLSDYPNALLRGESAYFRTHPDDGRVLAGRVLTAINGLIGNVRIASPNNASYTLASSQAPLFINIENKLGVPVRVGLQVSPLPGERGLVVKGVGVDEIPAGVTQQLKVQTRVERTGRFRVQLALVTPSGKSLGVPTQIRVKSTAFGAVGLWITGVAFGVLVLALLIRAIRRIRRRLHPAPVATSLPPAPTASPL